MKNLDQVFDWDNGGCLSHKEKNIFDENIMLIEPKKSNSIEKWRAVEKYIIPWKYNFPSNLTQGKDELNDQICVINFEDEKELLELDLDNGEPKSFLSREDFVYYWKYIYESAIFFGNVSIASRTSMDTSTNSLPVTSNSPVKSQSLPVDSNSSINSPDDQNALQKNQIGLNSTRKPGSLEKSIRFTASPIAADESFINVTSQGKNLSNMSLRPSTLEMESTGVEDVDVIMLELDDRDIESVKNGLKSLRQKFEIKDENLVSSTVCKIIIAKLLSLLSVSKFHEFFHFTIIRIYKISRI